MSGENLDLLKMFMNLLSTRTPNTDEEPAEFQIDDTYSVPGVGTVVSGTNLRGTIRLNDTLLLGKRSKFLWATIDEYTCKLRETFQSDYENL